MKRISCVLRTLIQALTLAAVLLSPGVLAQSGRATDEVLVENSFAKVTRGDYEAELLRLPPDLRGGFANNGKRVYDLMSGPNRTSPLLGPGGVSFYSPKPAEYIHLLNEYLRRESQISGRYFELSALVAAREFDQVNDVKGAGN